MVRFTKTLHSNTCSHRVRNFSVTEPNRWLCGCFLTYRHVQTTHRGKEQIEIFEKARLRLQVAENVVRDLLSAQQHVRLVQLHHQTDVRVVLLISTQA
jgi:hypothetical protein